MRLFKVYSLLLLLLTFPVIADEPQVCQQILDKVFKSIRAIKTVKYELKLTERIQGKSTTAKSFVKLNVEPRKVFMSNHRNIQILWVQGENDGNAVVHPNSFPYFTLNLDPYGSLMRKDEHHTIQELGFSFIGTTIANFVLKSPTFIESFFSCLGDITWDNKPCYKFYFNYPQYGYETYTVKKNETVRSIAKKLNIGEYKILEKNPRLTDFDEVAEGSKLTVPNCYGSTITMYIEKERMLPLYIKITDDAGVYEIYEYHNVEVNCTFAPDEFTRNFKGYKF